MNGNHLKFIQILYSYMYAHFQECLLGKPDFKITFNHLYIIFNFFIYPIHISNFFIDPIHISYPLFPSDHSSNPSSSKFKNT